MNRLRRSDLLEAIGEQFKDTRVLWSKAADHDAIETRRYVAELRDGALRAESPEGGLEIRPVAVRWQGEEAAYRSSQVTYGEAHGRKQAKYRNAFGPGLHLEYDFDERIVKKDLVIDALPEGAGDIEAVFEIESDAPLEIDGNQWDGQEIILDGEIKSGRWTIERPVAVSQDNTINPKLRLWRKGGKTYIAKILPRDWLASQTLPVRTDLTITLDGATTFESGDTRQVSAAALDSSHFVIAFQDYSDSSKGKVIAGSVSGTTITITQDSAITFESGSTYNIFIASLDSNHFVIAFNAGSSDSYVIVGSVSGTTITLGTAVAFDSNYSAYFSIASLDSSHFVIAFKGSGDVGNVIVGSVSGTTITITQDGATTFESGETHDISIATFDSSHFVIAFRDHDDSDKGKVITGSVSGTTITITQDGAITFESGNTVNISAASLDSSHFVIAFKDYGDSSKGKVIAGSVSGTTITITQDGATTFESGNTYYPSITALDSSHFVIAFQDYSDSSKGKVIVGSVSGTTITITQDSAITFESGHASYIFIATLDSSHFVIAFQDYGDGSKGKVIAGLETYSPTVTTQAATNVDNNSATGNGNITSDGGASIAQHGVCYKQGSDPVNLAGADGYTQEGAGSEGAFTSEMTGLDNGNTYYYRAYATNSVGTGYGAAQSFYTDKLLTISDSGVGFDPQPSIQTELSISDQGVGSSAPAIGKEFTLQETASGADSPVIAATLPLIQDSGGPGVDSVSWFRAVGLSDTGIGADASSIQITFTLTDTATGADKVTVGAAIILISDLGAGVDSLIDLLAQIPIEDSGVAQEILDFVVSFGLTDVGNIQDWLSLVKAFVSITDTGAGAEVGEPTVNNWIPRVAIDVQYPEEPNIEYDMD